MGVFKKLLSKLVYSRSIGLYVSDNDVTLSEIAWSPAGAEEVSQTVEPFEQDRLPEVMEHILRPWRSKRGAFRTPVSLGLSPFRIFFSSRPVKLSDKDVKPSTLLHEILQSSDINVDEMEVETLRGQPGKQPLISLIACKRRYLLSIITPLLECGIRPYRIEPSPFSLLRLASRYYPAPRKSNVSLRVFLGESQSVAMIVCGQVPLAWRSFELTTGNEFLSIRSGIMALQMVIRFRSEIPKPDIILIHGRPDLLPILDTPDFLESMGLKAKLFAEPSFDAPNIAKGLAIGTSQLEEEGFDLSRHLKPRPSLWDILPRTDIAVQFFLLNVLGFFLADYRNDLVHKLNRVKGEITKHAWMAKMSDTALETERNDTAKKVEAIQSFLESRILWSSYMQNTTDKLPASVTLRSFMGQCEMPAGGKKPGGKGKKSLVMRLSSPIPEGQVMPREVESYITTLRKDTLLQRDFPIIEVGDLKSMKGSSKSKEPFAEFVVTCLPKAAEKAAAKPKGDEKEKSEGH